MLRTTLVIIKLSVGNIKNSKRFSLILVSCVRIIPPQGIQSVSKILSKNGSNFFNFKKINTSIIFSKNKQFTKIKINTRNIYIYIYIYIYFFFFDSHAKTSSSKLVILNIWFCEFRGNLYDIEFQAQNPQNIGNSRLNTSQSVSVIWKQYGILWASNKINLCDRS